MMKEIKLDIALVAGYMLAERKIEIGDSREFVLSKVTELATEFYEKYNLNEFSPLENYMQLIDEFAVEKLFELYGIDKG